MSARRHVATPAELRAQDAAVANIFTEASVSRAQAGDPTTALACQWVGDVHRVTAALWTRASVHADPHQEFFSLAERVLTAAAHVVDTRATAPELLTELRAAFARACTGLNVPLVFPAATHLAPFASQLVELNVLRAQILGGAEPGVYVAHRLAGRRDVSPAGAVRMALEAYVVDVAERAGDVMLLTAVARLVAIELNAPRGGDDKAVLLAAAQRILGPVEWVRAGVYLQKAGVT